MSKFFSVAKRFTALTVTAMTILWSVGIAGLVPAATQAATPGSLIKQADLPGVYYYGADGNRYTFPNATTFETWYTGFNGVQTIPATELQAIRLAGNVTFRPGTYLVKITTDPAVYAVAPGGMLHWVTTEAIALALYGPNWAKMVRDVPDQLFPNYKFGSDIKTNAYPTGSVISHGGNNYYVDGTKARKITAEGFTANNFMSKFVVPASDAVFATLTMGTDITAADSTIWNVAGGAGSTQTDSSSVLSVATATTNPPSGVIVAGQATAPMLAFTVTGNGTLNSVTLNRTGISDQSTLSNVYLYDGATRLTDGYSFNNASTLVMNNLGIEVKGSRTIMVSADVYSSAVAGSTIGVKLASYSVTGGTSTTVSNVMGNVMSVAAGTSLASIVNGGSANVSAASVNAGTTQYPVWRQTFTVNTRTLQLKSANFRIIGSAPADALANAGLYIDGVKAGNTGVLSTISGSNYLVFDSSSAPINLTTGSHTFEVRADIVKGSSFNFTVSLQQASDVMLYDSQIGVNLVLNGTSIGTPFTALSAGQITIGSGSATVVVDPTFSSMTNITGGASNSVIGKFKIKGYGEDIKVTSLPVSVALSAAATPAGIQNVTLYFNGSQVGSQASITTGTGSLAPNCVAVGTGTCYSNTFNLGSQLIIPAGQDSTLEVRADLRNTAGTSYTTGTINAVVGVGSAEGQSSKTSVSFPSTAVTGTTLTIQAGALGVAKNPAYANQTVSPNTAGVKIASFVLQNQSSSEAVRVTTLTIDPKGAGTLAAYTDISGVKLSETSGNGSTPQLPTSANTFSVDFTIPAGGTKTVDVFADSSSVTGVTVIPTIAVNALGVSSNTTVTVAATAGQTITFNSGTVATPTLLTASATQAQYIAAGDTGASDATKASYNFVSTGGASTISELKFTVTGTGTVTTVKVGSVTAPVVNGEAWLQGLNLSVPNGGSGLSIDALVSYAPVGTSGITPGSTSVVALTYVKYTSGGTTSVITPSVSAPTMTMVGSKPVLTLPTTTASGLSISGETKIGEVTIAADAKGNLKVNDIVFTVSSSGFSTAPTAIGSPRIADGTTTIAGTTCTPASLVVTCEFGTSSNTDFDGYSIAAGTSKTFSLFGTLTGAAAIGSGIPTVSSSVGQSTFNWDDSSTNGVSGTNLTGTLIYNFPTSSFSIKQ